MDDLVKRLRAHVAYVATYKPLSSRDEQFAIDGREAADRIEVMARALHKIADEAAELTANLADGADFTELRDFAIGAGTLATAALSGTPAPTPADKCPMCNGEGWEWTDPPTNKIGDCSTCKGTGRNAMPNHRGESGNG